MHSGNVKLKKFKAMKTKKLTRIYFCKIYPEMKKLRKSDNYDFEIRFNDWKRLRQGYI